MKQLIVNRSGTTPVMEEVPTEKVKVYATEAAAIADLANIAEGEIVATSDESESDTIANLKNKIDNTEDDIEALQDGLAEAQSYSTDETLTGGTWIDGKPIYRKVLTASNKGTSSSFDFGQTILNVDKIVKVSGMIECNSGTYNGQQYQIPRDQEEIEFKKSTGVMALVNRNTSVNTDFAYIEVEYTKVTQE